jgi:hypothetical protein
MKASVVQEQILFIPDPVDRTYFMLRWPQWQ